MDILKQLYDMALERRKNPAEGSYTCYLFEQGIDKICKKIGEESAETVIAAKNGSPDELTNEISDLIYHLADLMAEARVSSDEVKEELERRSQKTGNLKTSKKVDKNT